MKSLLYILTFMIVLILPAGIFAGGFQVYPGARLEDIYEAKQPEAGTILNKMSKPLKVIVFTTHDPFESVVTFYRGIGREYRMRGGSRGVTKLPSGQELKEAYFIFDDAGDTMTSKHWVKIQRPYLSRERTREGLQGRYGPVREVTAIIEEDKRSYP